MNSPKQKALASIPLNDAVTQKQKSFRYIRMISHVDPSQIEDRDYLRQQLSECDFRSEINEYKVVIKKKTRKPINLKFKDGPSEEVIVDEKIAVNSDLKSLRQLPWKIISDPHSVLLARITRAKGEPFILPLIFSRLFLEGKQVLVTGSDALTKAQLLAVPDLTFKEIPEIVLQYQPLKKNLLERGSRAKGMQASMRELLDLPLFPEDIREKITTLASGQKQKLTEAETINLLLLSDLHNRYHSMLVGFEEDINQKKVIVARLASVFGELTQNVETSFLTEKLATYLTEKNERFTNNQHVFFHLYQLIQTSDQGKRWKDDVQFSKQELFRLLQNIIIFNRSQFDPLVWEQCSFIHPSEKLEDPLLENFWLIQQILDSARKSSEDISQEHKQVCCNLFLAAAERTFSEEEKPETINRLLYFFQQLHVGKKNYEFLISPFESPFLSSDFDREKFIAKFSSQAWSPSEINHLYDITVYLNNPNQLIFSEITQQIEKDASNHYAANSQSLIEIFSVHNAGQLIFGKKIHLGEQNLTTQETKAIRSLCFPSFKLHHASAADNKEVISLFQEQKEKDSLYHSVHFSGRIYGALLSHHMREKLDYFMEPGLRLLKERYQENLFEALFNHTVLSEGIPISRNLFARWINRQNRLGNLKERGWIQSQIEKHFDPNISPNILSGNGDSTLPLSYTEPAFHNDYAEAQKNFFAFFEKLAESFKQNPSPDNPAAILHHLATKGVFNFFSNAFRSMVQKSDLFKELHKVVAKSCLSMMGTIRSNATNNRIFLRVPLRFEEYLLFIGNSFELGDKENDDKILVKLLPTTASTYEDLKGVSRSFSELFGQYLADIDSPAKDNLLQTKKLLDEYRKVYTPYVKLLQIRTLDQLITPAILEEIKRRDTLKVSHLKYFVDNRQKWMVGRVKDQNLGNLSQYQKDGKGALVEPKKASYGEIVQVIYEITALKKHLAEIKETTLDIAKILRKIAQKSKLNLPGQRLYSLTKEFHALISLPLEKLHDANIQQLQNVADAIDKARYVNTGTSAPIFQQTQQLLKKQRKGAEKLGIEYYKPFTRRFEAKSGLIQKIRLSRVLLGRIENLRCIVFFPEGAKIFQIQYMIQIVPELNKNPNVDIDLFIETSSLSQEHIRELAKIYFPTKFFHIDEVVPFKPKQ